MTTAADHVLLPEGTRVIHIGPHKTGTTTLQGAFHASRRAIERQGVHYASPNRQAKQAARAVAGTRSAYAGGAVPSERHWLDLVDEVERSTAKRILISAEGFADAGDDAVRRMVRDLNPSLVRVVATLRPLARILPSQWQQYVQNTLSMPYEAWLHSILDDPDRAATPSFWRRHRHDRLIARWAAVAGPERTIAVVVDDRDHTSSLRAFERLLGLRAGTLKPAQGIYNRSLTQSEVLLVRAMHESTAALGIDKGLRLNLVLHGAAANMKLREPAKDEPRIETPRWAQERVAAITREIVDGIRASGVNVIGDLETLVQPPSDPREPEGDAADAAWPVIGGRALMGILTQTGLTRGADAREDGDAWPDDGVSIDRAPRAPVGSNGRTPNWDEWSTQRLASLVAGRVRSAAPAGLRGPLRVLRGLVGGRPGGRGGRTGRGRTGRAPILTAGAQLPAGQVEARKTE